MTTGQRIKAARKKVGMTQDGLGAKLGVSGNMIAQYETGKRNPKKETLIKIADALDIEPVRLSDDLFDEAFLSLFRDKKASEDFQKAFLSGKISVAVLHSDRDKSLMELYFLLNDYAQQKALIYVRSLAAQEGNLKGDSVGEDSRLPLRSWEQLDSAIGQLNTLGMEKAVERIWELSRIPEYQRERPIAAGNRAETTPQSASAPQEGKDTTPPPDAPETAPEGK